MKFKVGDRVKIVNTNGWSPNVKNGYMGTIIGWDKTEERYAVKFDHYDITSFHTCDGLCPNGYGFWCEEIMLELAYADGGIVSTDTLPLFIMGRRSGKNRWAEYTAQYFSELGLPAYLFSGGKVTKINKEDKPMRLTFYTTEGYRIDTSNNTKIPTITTKVDCIFGDLVYSGSATCDKFNYDEREGVLNAVSNALFRGKFDREYNRAVKANKEYEKVTRTCYYCGKVFDTVEERQAHEVWHVERRKARHERYLLRKRAKEIAFEEQAQKMAKEMLEEQK